MKDINWSYCCEHLKKKKKTVFCGDPEYTLGALASQKNFP